MQPDEDVPVAVPYPGLLRIGSRGADVRVLQARLAQLGVAALEVDGDFGPHTEAAVRAFQRSRRLGADGLVGPLTWAALWRP